jgi:hypothetical protein
LPAKGGVTKSNTYNREGQVQKQPAETNKH